MAIHWPETANFCGVFSHNVGVYVYTVTNVLYNGWLLYFIWGLFLRLIRVYFNSVYIEDYEESSEIGEVTNVLQLVLWCIVIAVSVYKMVETLSLVVLLCGVWMKKPAIVKIHMYFSVVNWIVGAIISFILSFFIDMPGRVLLILLILIHAYMILNIRSLYLTMTGKSRVVITPLDADNPAELESNNTQYPNTQEIQYTVPHCRTCNCNQTAGTPMPDRTFRYQTLNSNTCSAENTPTNENRTFDAQTNTRGILNNNRPRFLNLKKESISPNQNEMELRRRGTMQSPDSIDKEESIEVTDDQSNVDDKKENIETKDNMPVLYDENQLNAAASPIFEVNPITRTTDLRCSNLTKPGTSQN